MLKSIRKVVFHRTTLLIFCICFLLFGTYAFFYIKHCFQYESGVNTLSSQLAHVRRGFLDFKKNEHRWPICMDEVAFSPYNQGMDLGGNLDSFSDLPLRCVTLRNVYCYIEGDIKRKVLITLYKPYRTRLWPFGEMRTKVMLDNGDVRTISPEEIIEE